MTARFVVSVALGALVTFGAGIAHAQDASPFSPRQVEAIEKIVQDYLIANPEIIPQAIAALQEKERAAQETEAQRYLNERSDEIFDDPRAPVAGNPEGDVTIVEYVDYNCGYCKAVHTGVKEVVKADGNVKLMYKEFPILSESSVLAAQAALAANMQGKYEAFQNALIQHRGPLSDESISTIATDVGLDIERFARDMVSSDVLAALQKNQAEARNLSIRGTPSFVIGKRVIYGAVDKNTLTQLIAQARAPLDRENMQGRD